MFYNQIIKLRNHYLQTYFAVYKVGITKTTELFRQNRICYVKFTESCSPELFCKV